MNWPVCPECGERHPRADAVIQAIRENKIDDTRDLTFEMTLQDAWVVVTALKLLKETMPELETKVKFLERKLARQVPGG